MWRPLRSSPAFSLLVLPLALWSATPAIRWCPLGWDELRAEDFAACAATPATSCPATSAPLEVGSAGCCERACTPATESEAAPTYPGGRAYCLGGPSGGDGVPPIGPPVPDASGPSAEVPHAAALAIPRALAARPAQAAVAHPPAPPGGAVPRTRAPPPIGTTIG